MTVPAQRDATGPDTSGWRLLEAINRVDDNVRALSVDMAARFDRLDDRFMPRGELSARLEEGARDRADLRTQLTAERTKREADIATLTTSMEKAEQQRIAGRRWLVSVLVPAAGLLLSLTGLVLANLT